MASPAPKSPEQSERNRKYDRQLRYVLNRMKNKKYFQLKSKIFDNLSYFMQSLFFNILIIHLFFYLLL